MRILTAVLITLAATIGFAMNFNLRDLRLLFATGLAGAFGYGIYRVAGIYFVGETFPTLFAAFGVGVIGELFSRWFRAPALVLITPAIVVLVPGRKLYAMMLYFVQEEFWQAVDQGIQVVFIAGAIALGILASSLFSLSVRRMRRTNIKGKAHKI